MLASLTYQEIKIICCKGIPKKLEWCAVVGKEKNLRVGRRKV